ncbi:MAG: hypothetical protein NTZ24_14685 [Deltaproteobacteria bacterium]|nr:hypothetical protein [Deltaproteobacteria bacterium]
MPKLTKQQIIILSIMVVAVLYGGYDFFIASRTKSNVADVGKRAVEMGTFITDLSANVMRDQISPLDTNIISRAEAQWQRDPFFGRKAYREWAMVKEPAKASGGAQQVTFVYSGYLNVKDKNVAIINGVEYEAGDPLETEGYILKKINQNRVVIENIKSGSKFDVLLQE